MPSTHLSLHYHIVFSTKHREPWIARDWRDRIHAFLGGAIREIGGIADQIGGTDDHVHILAGLRARHCLSDVLCDIKSASSRWVHSEMRLKRFSWQEGYGAFTVSASRLAAVRAYIANQEAHHRRRNFQEEYVDLLRLAGIDYDEEHLW